jgi:N-terminal domain of (some) glycogen debranching enzymes
MTVALARFTLKDANVFLLADALGDIDAPDSGLFWDDTRMLSRLQLRWRTAARRFSAPKSHTTMSCSPHN